MTSGKKNQVPQNADNTIQFLGGAGTVTGSKHLLTIGDKRILVDCGLYQGIKNLRMKNRKAFPVDPKSIDLVILTHAHIDHSGYVPALIKQGYQGKIICTKATEDLCQVLLPDSGYLQEEEAYHANKYGYSKHSPAEPLYTEKDAQHALKRFQSYHYHEDVNLLKGIDIRFTPAGHILGSSAVSISFQGKTIVFSGDVGRQNDSVMRSPEPLQKADYLVIESTYGNRLHDTTDPKAFFADAINQTAEKGGIVLIPSFAVGRAQTILHLIQQLKEEFKIPDLPVYLNSPMAITATEIYSRHNKEHKLSPEQCAAMDKGTHFVRTADESRQLNGRKHPCIIISASGMASGGRVLHHLKSLVSKDKNSVVFVGFQAPGTRGDAMVNGTKHIKIHGSYLPVEASVLHLDSLSAHGDYEDILSWLDASKIAPKKVFITHGEPSASDSMRLHLQDHFHWNAIVPELGEIHPLT